MRINELAARPDITSWDQLIKEFGTLTERGERWIFRGQKDSTWFPESSLERAIERFSLIKGKANSTPEERLEHLRIVLREGLKEHEERGDLPESETPRAPMTALDLEDGLLRRFKRQCYHYLVNTPEPDNPLEWFALMRHHGAPTRLVDWTYSFFVAVFFALIDATDKCAVWAINTDWMRRRVRCVLYKNKAKSVWACFRKDRNIKREDTFNTMFRRKKPIPLVYLVNPYKLNPRLVIQQGTFLCPGDINLPFVDNLMALWPVTQCLPDEHIAKYIINVDKDEQIKILQNLYRMNMNRATLFPDLDGFAQSLGEMLIFPSILQSHKPIDEL